MKRKVLTTLVLFTSLALMACGGGGNKPSSNHKHTAAEGAEWQMSDTQHWKDCKDNDGGKAETGAHQWVADPDHPDVAATCQATGMKYEKCKVCGKTRSTVLEKSEHNWTEWGETGKSTVCEKIESRECQNTGCTEAQSRVTFISQHVWTVTKSVSKVGTTDIDYEEIECTVCHKIGIWFASGDMTVEGTKKSGGPEGCIKLENNGDSLTAIINLPEAKMGRAYLHAACGHWHDGSTNNNTKGFYVSGEPNIKFEINENTIDLSAKADLTYDDILSVDETHDSSNYSAIGDADMGVCSLKAGLNTIKYTRLGSYNLTVQKFIFVF